MRFKFNEMVSTRPSEYNEAMIRKINSVNSQKTYFSMQNTAGVLTGQAGFAPKASLYKMLKCESKLVKYLFELNGLQCTDRHDWNVLWTHTQGKNYFYERLNPYQKINHFPNSIELTHKDKMVVNIKKMQDKYSKTYFNFIPETFLLPD